MSPDTATGSGIILFAHGARDPEWATPFIAIRELIARARPDIPVQLAFLEIMTPSLEGALADLLQQGVGQVTITPLFMARGGHLKQDLPKLLAELRTRYPDVALNITPPIGESPELLQTIADWVMSAHRASSLRH